MEIPDELSPIIYSILLSHICATGESLPDFFEVNPDYEELFNMVNEKVVTEREAPGHAIDGIQRALRKHIKSPNPVPDKDKTITRNAHRKTGSRYSPGRQFKPHNKGEIKENDYSKELIAALKFLKDSLTKSGVELKVALENFPHKKELFYLVDHLISTGMGGWKATRLFLVNETGHRASHNNWELLKNGRLSPKNGAYIQYDNDWLFNIREQCNARL